MEIKKNCRVSLWNGESGKVLDVVGSKANVLLGSGTRTWADFDQITSVKKPVYNSNFYLAKEKLAKFKKDYSIEKKSGIRYNPEDFIFIKKVKELPVDDFITNVSDYVSNSDSPEVNSMVEELNSWKDFSSEPVFVNILHEKEAFPTWGYSKKESKEKYYSVEKLAPGKVDEKKWDEAKAKVKKQKDKNITDFSDRDWGLVNHIYQNMGGTFGSVKKSDFSNIDVEFELVEFEEGKYRPKTLEDREKLKDILVDIGHKGFVGLQDDPVTDKNFGRANYDEVLDAAGKHGISFTTTIANKKNAHIKETDTRYAIGDMLTLANDWNDPENKMIHVLDIDDTNYTVEERPIDFDNIYKDSKEYGVRYEIPIKTLDKDKKMIKYCASKKEMEKFNSDVEQYMKQIGASEKDSNEFRKSWVVDTQAGPLTITLHNPDTSRIFSIYTMFEDVDKAKDIVSNINPYSGKWNFHGMHAQDVLDDFMNDVGTILEKESSPDNYNVSSVKESDKDITLAFNDFDVTYDLEGNFVSAFDKEGNVVSNEKFPTPYRKEFGLIVKTCGVEKIKETIAIKRIAMKKKAIKESSVEKKSAESYTNDQLKFLLNWAENDVNYGPFGLKEFSEESNQEKIYESLPEDVKKSDGEVLKNKIVWGDVEHITEVKTGYDVLTGIDYTSGVKSYLIFPEGLDAKFAKSVLNVLNNNWDAKDFEYLTNEDFDEENGDVEFLNDVISSVMESSDITYINPYERQGYTFDFLGEEMYKDEENNVYIIGGESNSTVSSKVNIASIKRIASIRKKAKRLGNYEFDVHGGENWVLEAGDDGKQKIKRIEK